MPTGSITWTARRGTLDTFKFDVGYEYNSTSAWITSVKTTALSAGFASWTLAPDLYFYIVQGSEIIPKDLQHSNPSYSSINNTNIENWINARNGKYKNYSGNTPANYLSNTKNGEVTWRSSDISGLSVNLSEQQAFSIGACISNTSKDLSEVVYGGNSITVYTAPSNFTISIIATTESYIDAKVTWTNGTNNSIATVNIPYQTSYTITTSNTTVRFSNLNSNTSYTISGFLTDNISSLSATASSTTTISAPIGIAACAGYTTLAIYPVSSNLGPNFKYQYFIRKVGDTDGSWVTGDDINTVKVFNNLIPNTKYYIWVRCTDNNGNNPTAQFPSDTNVGQIEETKDARTIYVNGELRDVFVITTNKVTHIYPEAITIIK